MGNKIAHTAFRENKRALFSIDGKIYTRVVRFRRDCGLYVKVNNTLHFEYEFEYIKGGKEL